MLFLSSNESHRVLSDDLIFSHRRNAMENHYHGQIERFLWCVEVELMFQRGGETTTQGAPSFRNSLNLNPRRVFSSLI